MKRWLRRCLFLGLWLAIGLLFASQLYLFYGHTKTPMTWKSALTWEVTKWSLWAVVSPLILLLIRRFPLQWNKLRSLLFHVLMSVLISFAHLVLYALALAFLLGAIPAEKFLFLKVAESFSVVATTVQLAFGLDFHVGIIVYWVILILNSSFANYRRASKLEAQLATAQLHALKMQLHPHFLFNTLNSISALLHKDVEAADEMIGELGDFLRLTLLNSGAQEVRLREELEFFNCYLAIERVRFDGGLNARVDIEPETSDAQVPNLILQPIVENAIRHGISQRAGPGHIEIRARRVHEMLQLQVKDDGPGLPLDKERDRTVREGIGLSNTRARLQQMYGDSHRFELANAAEGGVVVTLEIPFRQAAVLRNWEGASDDGNAGHTNVDRG